MVCQALDIMGSNLNIVDLLVYPTTCFYYTYAIIFFAFFIILALFLYNREREQFVKPDMISSLGTSATAVLFLGLIGTLIKTDSNIPMVQSDIFLYMFVIWIVIMAIWYFKRD